MTGALRRVFGAPGLILIVAAIQLTVAAVLSGPAKAAAAAAMGKFAVVADGGLMGSMVKMLFEYPSVPAAIRPLLAGSAMLALALWTLLAAGIIHRLHSPAPASEVAAAAVRGLPAVVVVTLWQLVPRLVLLALTAMVSGKILALNTWGWLGFVPLLVVLGYVTCALDLARCDAVLHGARRFHVRTALGGFSRALRRPGVLLPSMFLNACQWACAGGILAVSFSGFGSGWAIWVARALAVAGVVFGLSRVAVAVEAGPASRPEESPHPRPLSLPPSAPTQGEGRHRPPSQDPPSADEGGTGAPSPDGRV